MKHPKLTALLLVVIGWYALMASLPRMIMCGPSRRVTLARMTLYKHMYDVWAGEHPFESLSWLDRGPNASVLKHNGYRAIFLRTEDTGTGAVVVYPTTHRVLTHGWAECLLTLRCQTGELPSFALLEDGRVFEDDISGYDLDHFPDTASLPEVGISDSWEFVAKLEDAQKRR